MNQSSTRTLHPPVSRSQPLTALGRPRARAYRFLIRSVTNGTCLKERTRRNATTGLSLDPFAKCRLSSSLDTVSALRTADGLFAPNFFPLWHETDKEKVRWWQAVPLSCYVLRTRRRSSLRWRPRRRWEPKSKGAFKQTIEKVKVWLGNKERLFPPLSPSSSQPKPSQPFTPQRILELLGLLLVRATSHSDVCVFEKYGVRHLNYCYFCYWCRFYVFVLLITEISNIYLPLNAATHPTPENKVL